MLVLLLCAHKTHGRPCRHAPDLKRSRAVPRHELKSPSSSPSPCRASCAAGAASAVGRVEVGGGCPGPWAAGARKRARGRARAAATRQRKRYSSRTAHTRQVRERCGWCGRCVGVLAARWPLGPSPARRVSAAAAAAQQLEVGLAQRLGRRPPKAARQAPA